MADKISSSDTSQIETKDIGSQVESMMSMANNQRKTFARHWYDNNFFDDGHHLRSLSRTTGKIVDLSSRATLYSPRRAIPKASRQIRGMANLMLSQDFVPIIRPEAVTKVNYPQMVPDPQTGEPRFPEYEAAMLEAKNIAKRSGHWLTEEWNNQELDIKLALMLILTLKNYVSYMQIWPDAVEEGIKTQVYDAFDIYLMNGVTEIYDSPFIIKAIPKLIRELKANENFDQEQLKKISPDNRYASDEIKEAYLISQFGKAGSGSDSAATLLLKEAFIKEYINDDNMDKIRKSEAGKDILKNKKKGDPVIRQIFVAGSVWLRDEYTNLPDYPFVDLRLEPGPIYGVSQIERFIPANKSLDSVVSRIERWLHTMNVGVWTKRKGENFKLSNVAGGLVAEYDAVPPQQMQVSSMTQAPFQFAELLNGLIEEQGVTTSALGQLPKGVKAWGAIESLKASEFSNLYIAIKQIKNSVKRISEKMFDIADNHFINRKTVMRLEKGEPDYFDVVGQAGIDTRKDIKEADTLEGVVPLKKEYHVDISVESGLGYTEEGKKGSMMEIANFMLGLGEKGLLPPQALKAVIERLLEVFKFGPTADMLDALEGMEEMGQVPDQQIQQMKVALLETLKDASGAGMFEQEADEKQMVDATKVGVLESLKQSGMIDKINKGTVEDNPELAPIPYKDAPGDIRRQMEVKAGLVPSTQETLSPIEVDSKVKQSKPKEVSSGKKT